MKVDTFICDAELTRPRDEVVSLCEFKHDNSLRELPHGSSSFQSGPPKLQFSEIY
jgi:hypothetical protein